MRLPQRQVGMFVYVPFYDKVSNAAVVDLRRGRWRRQLLSGFIVQSYRCVYLGA